MAAPGSASRSPSRGPRPTCQPRKASPEMPATKPRVLIIEDEKPIRAFLRASLAGEGHEVVEAETGREGLAQATMWVPDLVVLDLGLPDVDGIEVIRDLRKGSQVPIVILSARGQERDKVAALDAGADDYLTKPFGIRELLARVRVALRHAARVAAADATPVAIAEFRMDFEARRVFVGDRELHLTPTNTSSSPPSPATPARCSPTVTCSRKSGAGAGGRRALPSRVHGRPAAEDRGRSLPSALPVYRARRGLPLCR